MDVDAGLDARHDLNRLNAEIIVDHVLDGIVDRRHHRGHDHALDLAFVIARVFQKHAQQHAVFIVGLMPVGRHSPGLFEPVVLKQSAFDVGIAYIQCQDHAEDSFLSGIMANTKI